MVARLCWIGHKCDYAETLFPSFRCLGRTLRADLRGARIGCPPYRSRPGPQWNRQQAARLETRHEMQVPGLQEPLEGAALPLLLRGALEAAEEEAGRGADQVGSKDGLAAPPQAGWRLWFEHKHWRAGLWEGFSPPWAGSGSAVGVGRFRSASQWQTGDHSS